MRIPLLKSWAVRIGLLVALLAGSVYLVSADGPDFSIVEKAYYANAYLMSFVRPGLTLKIVSAQIGADGTISARFTATDPKGLPLDRDGVYTPGPVSTSFVAAYIPKGKTQYVSYTTRPSTAANGNGVTLIQAGADSGGTYTKNADGDYTYTFKTKAPAGYDRTATHTIGLYGSRNLAEFDLPVYGADTTFNFVPDGSAVTVTRDVIRTVTCNKCHQDLAAHGTGGRKSMPVCILCHTSQSINPATGNTADMAVMIHKIHTGENLPSVQAGTPYQFITSHGNADFSKVVFPAYPDTRNCTFCHEQTTGAAQSMAYLTPNMAACRSCHDNVNFATGENHAGLVQNDSSHCAECHLPEGETEFDLSVTGAHTIAYFSNQLKGVVFELISVTNAGPGLKPTVTFSIKDKSGATILPSTMSRLRLLVAGPNTDFPSSISEDASKASVDAGGGTFAYTFTAALPADAKGSFSIGMEGYNSVTIYPGTDAQQTARDIGANKQLAFSVDGSPVVPRRTTVTTANCAQCHGFLSFHGGNRNTPQECVFCHTPNATATAAAGSGLPPQSIDFRTMIHKIHTGENLVNDYSIGKTSFNEVLFPGDRRNCTACHVNDSQQLPLPQGTLPVVDPQGYLNPDYPEAAACTSCHGTIQAASHALINTVKLGAITVETCSVCHGTTSDFSVNKVHAH
jgi:OmcA/MtrC family decaheme c-type cytochrome